MANLSDPTFWIPTIISLIAVLLFYVDTRRRQKADREAGETMVSLIRTMGKELDLIKQQIGQSGMTKQQIALQKNEELDWKKLKDIAKGVGWIFDRLNEDDD